MAIIGLFTKDGAGFTGSIETLTFKAVLTLEPNTSKKSDKAPDFLIHRKADGFTSEIGAYSGEGGQSIRSWRTAPERSDVSC